MWIWGANPQGRLNGVVSRPIITKPEKLAGVPELFFTASESIMGMLLMNSKIGLLGEQVTREIANNANVEAVKAASGGTSSYLLPLPETKRVISMLAVRSTILIQYADGRFSVFGDAIYSGSGSTGFQRYYRGPMDGEGQWLSMFVCGDAIYAVSKEDLTVWRWGRGLTDHGELRERPQRYNLE